MNSAVPAGLVVFLKPTHLRAGLLSATPVQISFSMVGCRPFCLRSAARWRDLRLILGVFKPWWKRRPTLCHPERSRGICSSAGPSWKCFFDRVLMQVEVKVCRAYGARTMLGNRCPSPGRAGLMFGGRPYGPQSPDRFLETHFQDEPAELQIPRLRSG